MENELLSVGELAKKMNVSVRTLQFYDKEGILKSSAKSEGGRRLYTNKDVVKLHQILSLKYLGFSLEEIKTKLLSLDKPEEVARILDKQKELVLQQIDQLKTIAVSIDSLQQEVLQMKNVDFNKYAYIVTLLRQNNPDYWVVKLFDDNLISHLRDRFGSEPDKGRMLIEKYTALLDEALDLQARGESPVGEKGLALAKQWWEMIMEFTGGDFNMLPKLMKFNENKQGWDEKIADKQRQADDYIEQALGCYFEQQGIQIPFMEE